MATLLIQLTKKDTPWNFNFLYYKVFNTLKKSIYFYFNSYLLDL